MLLMGVTMCLPLVGRIHSKLESAVTMCDYDVTMCSAGTEYGG